MKINFEFIRKILRMTYNLLLAVMLIDFACFACRKNTMNAVHILLLLTAFILSYIIRDYIMNNFLILLLHGLTGTVVFLAARDGFIKWLLVIAVLYLYMESTAYVMRHGKLKPLSDMPWPTFLISLFIYIMGLYMKEPDMVKMAYIIPVILFILYLLMLYAEGMTGYVKAAKDVSGLPLKRILSANTLIILGIIVIVVLSVFLAQGLHLDTALMNFGRGLIRIFRLFVLLAGLLFTLIGRLVKTGSVRITSEETAPVRELLSYDNTVASWLELILKLAVIALAAFVIFKIVRKLIRFFLTGRTLDSDTVEAVSKEEDAGRKEKLHILQRIQEKFSYEERARKIYRDKVRRYHDYYVPDERKTVLDIQQDVEKHADDDISRLSELYQFARYGDQSVTKDIIKEMKSLSD